MAVPPKEVFALVWIGQKKILFANGQGIVLRGRIPKLSDGMLTFRPSSSHTITTFLFDISPRVASGAGGFLVTQIAPVAA